MLGRVEVNMSAEIVTNPVKTSALRATRSNPCGAAWVALLLALSCSQGTSPRASENDSVTESSPSTSRDNDVANGQSGDLGTESTVPDETCPWDLPPPGSNVPPVPGPPMPPPREPTQAEQEQYLAEAVRFAHEFPEVQLDLFWLTQAQDHQRGWGGFDAHVEPGATQKDVLHLSFEPGEGEPELDKCASPALVPLRLTVESKSGRVPMRSSEAIAGVAPGALRGIFDLAETEESPAQRLILDYVEARGWQGSVFPAEPVPPLEEPPESPPVFDDTQAIYGRFPVACGGFAQVAASESAGLVSSVAVRDAVNSLPEIEVSFSEFGDTSFHFEVGRLSETSCVDRDSLSFGVEYALVHADGARHQNAEELWLSACSDFDGDGVYVTQPSCVHLALTAAVLLRGEDALAAAVMEDLDLLEIATPEDAFGCDLRLTVTDQGVTGDTADCWMRLGDEHYGSDVVAIP
jgi:hypothetical protein